MRPLDLVDFRSDILRLGTSQGLRVTGACA